MVFFQLLESSLELNILLHAVVIVLLLHFGELVVHFLFLGGHHELLAVLALYELLSDLGFVLLAFKILCLFADDGAPLVHETSLVHRVVPLLLVIQLLN